jgi:hypothetical protein
MDDAALREELEQLALSGDGYDALLRRLADVTGRVVRLIAVHGGLLATSEPGVAAPAASTPASGVPASESLARGIEPAVARHALERDAPTDVRATDGLRAVALALHAGPRRVGLLLVEAPADARVLAMMRAAAVPLAIEAVRRDAQAAARAESAVRLVEELRTGSFREPDQIVHAAQRFGLRLDRPHAAAVFAYDGHHTRTWHTATQWIEMPVFEEDGRGWTVLAGDVGAELRRIRARLEGIVGDAPVLAASGPIIDAPAATAGSFREAELVLALLRHRRGGAGGSRRPDDQVVLAYDELGLSALLLSVPRERLEAYVDARLGPLLARPELVETLRAWYGARGSRAAVADALGIHRNSVGYRIGRVRTLLGVDPLAPDSAPALQAALAAHELLAAVATA